MRYQTFTIVFAGILLASCGQKKKQLSFYGNEDIGEDTTVVVPSQTSSQITYDADSEVSVPFEEQSGVKHHRCDRKWPVYCQDDTRQWMFWYSYFHSGG